MMKNKPIIVQMATIAIIGCVAVSVMPILHIVKFFPEVDYWDLEADFIGLLISVITASAFWTAIITQICDAAKFKKLHEDYVNTTNAVINRLMEGKKHE